METTQKDQNTLRVRVLLFSVLREEVGVPEIEVELERPATGGDLLDHLASEHEAVHARRPTIRLAVDESFVAEEVALEEGDEVALVTPVSGG